MAGVTSYPSCSQCFVCKRQQDLCAKSTRSARAFSKQKANSSGKGNRGQNSLHAVKRAWISSPTVPQRQRSSILCRALSTEDKQQNPKVVGLGGVGLDYLAQVAAFPQPDEKLRTEKMETRGGGNCANALTAAARLGLDTHLVSKVGDDSIGDAIEQELHADGVQTDFLLRAESHPSPFTYIILDRAGGTRTCIHTPGAAFGPENLNHATIDRILTNAQLVYFDGRLTEAAVVLAREACKREIPVLVEAERLRPVLDDLVQEADYVCTSAHFPQQWTGEAKLGDALCTTLQRLPKAKWLSTTLGKRGSILIARHPNPQQATESQQPGDISQSNHPEAVLDELLEELLQQVNDSKTSGNGIGNDSSGSSGSSSGSVGCSASNGITIRAGHVTSTKQPYKLLLHRSPDDVPEATAAAFQAAAKEASANADSNNAEAYGRQGIAVLDSPLIAQITVASAATIPQEAIEDTTGAGDAFIGSMLYGVTKGMPHGQMLRLAAVVAACKCTALGARPGLPHADSISPELLSAG